MASTNVGVQEMPRPSDVPGADSDFARTPLMFPQQIGWQDGGRTPFRVRPRHPMGLGVEMDLDVAAGSPLTPGNWPPRLSREDGAFTNW